MNFSLIIFAAICAVVVYGAPYDDGSYEGVISKNPSVAIPAQYVPPTNKKPPQQKYTTVNYKPIIPQQHNSENNQQGHKHYENEDEDCSHGIEHGHEYGHSGEHEYHHEHQPEHQEHGHHPGYSYEHDDKDSDESSQG